jgi:hypothetical protein
MMRKNLVTTSVVVVTTLFLAGVLASRSAGQPAKTEPPSAASRLAAAERVCRMLHDQATGAPGHLVVEHTYVWSMRWMQAQRDVDAAADGDRFAALEAHLKRMRDFRARVAELHKQDLTSKFDVASTEYYVAEAEELLTRAKAK